MPGTHPHLGIKATDQAGNGAPIPPLADVRDDADSLPAGQWRTAQRIAASAAFHKSPRLRNLLLFIAERSIAGRGEELTELEIGRKVFERGASYIPADDSIVRSSIRQLRLKLMEFYESEGQAEAWLLEVPKGAYVAVFRRRDDQVTAIPPEHERKPSGNDGPMKRPGLLIMIGVLALVFVLSLAANAYLLARLNAAADRGPWSPSLAGALVVNSRHRTQVVVDDFAWVLMGFMSANRYSLDDYASRSYLPLDQAPSQDPQLLRLWKLLGTRYLVSMGAVASVDRIYRCVPDLSKLSLRHARNMTIRDFQDGSLIVYGQPPNNPWTQLFEEKLNFQRTARGEAAFLNLHPGQGELARYSAPQSASINSGAGYARIALLPNLSGSGFVLLVSGLNMVTSEAAAEYATNPRNLPEVLKLFQAKSVAELPHLELLLETSAFDSAPKDVRIIAWRRIAPHR